MAKDYKKVGCKSQRFAGGGKVVANMMNNWQNAVRSGNTGPIYVNPRFADKRALGNNAFAAFMFDGFRPQVKRKKDG